MKSKLNPGHCKLLPMLKVKIVDVISRQSGSLHIWNPNDDLVQGLKEKSVMQVFNLNVGKVRNDDISFKTTKLTRFQRINNNGFDSTNFERKLITIDQMLGTEFDPKFKDVDTIGIVINIEELLRGFQAVHICDTMMNFVSIQFFGGLKKFCAESIVKIARYGFN